MGLVELCEDACACGRLCLLALLLVLAAEGVEAGLLLLDVLLLGEEVCVDALLAEEVAVAAGDGVARALEADQGEWGRRGEWEWSLDTTLAVRLIFFQVVTVEIANRERKWWPFQFWVWKGQREGG